MHNVYASQPGRLLQQPHIANIGVTPQASGVRAGVCIILVSVETVHPCYPCYIPMQQALLNAGYAAAEHYEQESLENHYVALVSESLGFYVPDDSGQNQGICVEGTYS